ncbi:MAG: hypothetical protein K6G26_04205 [Lachnospiraceae bacterium]|nr:hypothetical protein [Lachnospiraceae bacterium]
MKRKALLLAFCLGAMLCGCNEKTYSEEELLKEKAASATEIATDFSKEDSIIYQVNVRSFYDSDGDGIGDFEGIVEKMDYIKSLGVNELWLISAMKSNSNDGYDVIDYYDVEESFGNMNDFENLIDTCHKNGIKVMIDFSVNFTADSNMWFSEAIRDPLSEYAEYYHLYRGEQSRVMGDNYHKISNSDVYYWGHYGASYPNLNFSSSLLRKKIEDVAKFWIEKGVDGFAIDKCKRLDKDESVIHDWLKNFTKYVNNVDPDVMVMGRITSYKYGLLSPYAASLNAFVQYPYKDALVGSINDSVDDYISEYNYGMKCYSEYIKTDIKGHDNFVFSVNTSDVIEDRVASRITNGVMGELYWDKLKMMAAMVLTSPGIPVIYFGDEIGMKELATNKYEDSLTMLREPMEWTKIGMGAGVVNYETAYGIESKYAKPSDGISVEEQDNDEDSVLNYYRKFVKLRKENPTFADGAYETIGIKDKTIAYTVKGAVDGSALLVLHNVSNEDMMFRLQVDATNLLDNVIYEKGTELVLGGYKSVIFKYFGDSVPLDENKFVKFYEKGRKVKITVKPPARTFETDNLFVAGTFSGWEPNDEKYKMTRNSDGTYSIEIPMDDISSFEYKITRGSWDFREQLANGSDNISGSNVTYNRSYSYSPDNNDITIVVEKWSDR